jgi:cob(I)alamin adenosyltransferase
MVVVFTGNGKGKTTAALGAAVRAVGRGQKVLMVQFIKGPWKSGEDFSTELLKPEVVGQSKIGKGGITFKKMGLGFVGILGDQLPFEEHVKAAQKALSFVREQLANYDMVIMDEVNVAVSLKLVTAQEVLDMLKDLPPEKIVLLTGRDAPQEFIDRADLATEMREIKHPFAKGQLGKLNIEF